LAMSRNDRPRSAVTVLLTARPFYLQMATLIIPWIVYGRFYSGKLTPCAEELRAVRRPGTQDIQFVVENGWSGTNPCTHLGAVTRLSYCHPAFRYFGTGDEAHCRCSEAIGGSHDAICARIAERQATSFFPPSSLCRMVAKDCGVAFLISIPQTPP
jgi:hypothetical protein